MRESEKSLSIMSTRERKSIPSDLYTEEYFLTACEGYDVFLESEGQHLSRRLRDAFEVADVQPGMRLLDVGSGRGEILRHCMELGVDAFGVDYAEVAAQMSRDTILTQRDLMVSTVDGDYEDTRVVQAGVCRSDAKRLPFADEHFDRVLMFDVVEHLYPWELHEALLEHLAQAATRHVGRDEKRADGQHRDEGGDERDVLPDQ